MRLLHKCLDTKIVQERRRNISNLLHCPRRFDMKFPILLTGDGAELLRHPNMRSLKIL